MKSKNSFLVQPEGVSSSDFSSIFEAKSEDVFSTLSALMADGKSSNQVCSESLDSAICPYCDVRENMVKGMEKTLQAQSDDYDKISETNRVLTEKDKEYKETIKTLKNETSDLKKTIVMNQNEINRYIELVEHFKKDNAVIKSEHDTIKRKLDSYANSQYVLDHIIEN